MNAEDQQSADEAAEDSSIKARREALKRLGIYGAMTGPVMMALLSSKASAQVPVDSGETDPV